ncbi:MAG: hypothetical protein OER86_08875, partial [Phycisphaerae bacterium]|nr:hypothetical protein [Phycisphaerae bacterium]
IAYEVLVGRPAFAENFKAVMRDQRHQAMRWMKWHTNVRVQAPPITQLNPQVPDVLADLVQRMMSKDAAQRIATAEQLLEAIHGHFSKSGQRATAVAAARAAAAAATATAPVGGSFDQPTAPLKKTSKLVWALVAIFGLQGIFFGGYYWSQQSKKQDAAQQKENAARDKYNRAMEAFDNNNWTASQQIFNELAVEYPDGTLGVRCSAYSLVCLARLEMDEADTDLVDSRFDEALQSYATAGQALETAEEQALRVNAAKLIGRLDDRKKEVGKRKAFIEVARAIDTAINNQQFDTARRRHYELHSKAGVLIDSERRVVGALGIRIEDQQQNQLLAADLAEARRLFEAGRRVEARQTILDAIDRHGNKTVLTDLMGTVDTDINYRNSLTAATDAESGGQLEEAVVAYLRVNAIRPDKKWTDKIADLRSRKAFAVGQDFEAGGNIPAAAQKYREADNFKEHPQARARLKALKMEGERSDFIRDGDALVSAGNYQAAIAAFQRAQGISSDPEVAQKIQRAQVRLHVKEAVAQLNLGKMDDGEALLKKALAIDPNDPQAVAYMDQIKIRTRLTQLGAEGDDLRNKSKFSRAKSSYKSAIALAKENALTNARKKYEQRLFETEFDHLIAQSRNAMELSLWTQAKAFISTAKKMRPDDPRLPKLEFEINEKAPKDS